jgi:hypothetical protein
MPGQVLVCVFRREEDFLRAATTARDRGFAVVDAFTPYAVHGVESALGLPPSRLPQLCLALGVLGAASILLFQYWVSTVSWPLNVGGRPWNSWPAFVPATFEMMVAFGGLGTAVAFIVVSGLRPWRRPSLPHPKVTDDRFAIMFAEGAGHGLAEIESVMTLFHPEVTDVREAEA